MPDLIFAPAYGELMRSVDGGSTWQHIRYPKGAIYPTSIRIDPKDPNTVYIADYSVFVSHDKGITWSEIADHPFQRPSEQPVQQRIYDLEFDPNDPRIIYGVAPGTYCCEYSTPNRVWKSVDGGRTWKVILSTSAQLDAGAQQLEIHPNGRIIFATFGIAVFKSINAGKTWERLNRSQRLHIENLLLDASNPDVLYASNSNAGLFRSTDSGKTWMFTGNKCGPLVSIDPTNSKILYTAGVLADAAIPCAQKSSDDGRTWFPIRFPHFTPTDRFNAFSVNPTRPNVVLAATNLLYRSTDGGASWSIKLQGKGIGSVAGLVANSNSPVGVYGQDCNRLFVFTAPTGNWRLLNTPPTFCIYDVEVPKQNANIIIAAGSHTPLTTTTSEAMIMSFDGGASWQYRKAPSELMVQVVLDPLNYNTLYAIGFHFPTRGTVSKSTDLGTTWKTFNTTVTPTNICMDPQNSSVLYASVSHGVLKTVNSGASWTFHKIVPTKEVSAMDCGINHLYFLLFDAATQEMIFARSDDRGISIHIPKTILTNPSIVKAHPTIPNLVFAQTSSGLYFSGDAGETWQPFPSNGLPPDKQIFAIEIPAVRPDMIFAATSRGVYTYANQK